MNAAKNASAVWRVRNPNNCFVSAATSGSFLAQTHDSWGKLEQLGAVWKRLSATGQSGQAGHGIDYTLVPRLDCLIVTTSHGIRHRVVLVMQSAEIRSSVDNRTGQV